MAITKTIKNNVTFFASDILAVPHGFTTRLGGVSTGVLSSLNLGFHRGDLRENIEENYRLLGQAVGFSPENCVLTRQTHSDIVRVVTAEDRAGLDHRGYPECDGLITMDPGVALVIFTADCTPLLFHDPVTGAVGAAHAGWRGTVSQIGAKTVEAMVRSFGCDPQNIRAAIGPNIGQCHFETDADVPQAILAAYGPEAEEYIEKRGEKYYLDLKAINALSLRRAGVKKIDISDACTYCLHDTFWSHRYTQGARGSQGAVIVCQKGSPYGRADSAKGRD